MLPNAQTGTALQWFTGWTILLVALVLLARSSWGKPIVSYTVWLAIAILVLTHASDIAALFPAPLTGGTQANG